MINTPVFTISLDFELHWGRFDKAKTQGNEKYYLQTKEVIPKILRLFEEFQIEATWATVGMLFAGDLQEWEKYAPVEKPSYVQQNLSAYQWLKRNPAQEAFLFAPELIEKILLTRGQELGSHTFSHYYTLADGQTGNQFRQDLQAAQRIARDKFGVNLCALIIKLNDFPVTP
ncbi:MAG: polysaccharide deacetylase family protein [Anditalea sp.]